MFGIFKKSIPASNRDRAELVKNLFLYRCYIDPGAREMARTTGTAPGEIPAELLLQGSPEGTILRVMEQYLPLRDGGLAETKAISVLQELHASMARAQGFEYPENSAKTLNEYLPVLVNSLHGHGVPLPPGFLIECVKQIKAFYRRA